MDGNFGIVSFPNLVGLFNPQSRENILQVINAMKIKPSVLLSDLLKKIFRFETFLSDIFDRLVVWKLLLL